VQHLDRAVFYRKKHGPAAIGAQPSAFVPAPVLPHPWQPPTVTVPRTPRTRGAIERTLLAAPASVGEEPSKTPSLLERIDHHLSRQEFAEAERVIDAVSARKERAAARLRYVLHLVGCAEIQRAKDMLERCLSEEPLQIEAHLLKASLAEEAGNLAEAEGEYRRALYVDRRCAIAHFHLALVQQEQNDVNGSRRSLQTVLDLTQNSDPNELAEHSDGVCYGRLREMVEMILDF
jgi:Tfp pilus assembly protein PilF